LPSSRSSRELARNSSTRTSWSWMERRRISILPSKLTWFGQSHWLRGRGWRSSSRTGSPPRSWRTILRSSAPEKLLNKAVIRSFWNPAGATQISSPRPGDLARSHAIFRRSVTRHLEAKSHSTSCRMVPRDCSPDAKRTGTAGSRANFGQNDWLVDQMYQQYKKDPESVDPEWRKYFEKNGDTAGSSAGADNGAATSTQSAPAASAGAATATSGRR